jgi:uncharacterized protein YfaP (DUF2135 family)
VIADGVDYYGISEATTDANGRFRITVKPNSRVKIWVTKGGESSEVKEVTTPSEGEELDLGEILLAAPTAHIALTWGEDPDDLDSHLAGIIAGENVHVYYGNKVEAGIELDTDDTSSYGPEIITIAPGVGAGTYRYSVRRYAGKGSIENSGAVVNLIAGGKIRTFTPPVEQPAETRLWRVFDLTIDSAGNVTSVDVINDYVTSYSDKGPEFFP